MKRKTAFAGIQHAGGYSGEWGSGEVHESAVPHPNRKCDKRIYF